MSFLMQSTAAALEARIRSHHPLKLTPDWAQELIFPAYDALSLRNVAHTVAALLGAPLPEPAPLDAALWGGTALAGAIDRVVLFLIDGMGYLYLQQLIAQDAALAQIVHDLTEGRGPLPLTSVMPSTTATALPVLWTGAAPGQTGMVGTLLYLREIATIGNMLSFGAAVGDKQPDTFDRWGLPVETLVPVPGLAEMLAQAGIATHLVAQRALMRTGLSRILHRGAAHEHTYYNATDAQLQLEAALTQTRGQRAYVSEYWGDVDALSHIYGAHNRYTHLEITNKLRSLRDVLAQPAVRDGRTLVMIVADHGHYEAPHATDLATHPAAADLRAALPMYLTGDGRLGYLRVRDGQRAAVRAQLEAAFGEMVAVMNTEDALAAGLYGPSVYAETPHRIGDLIVAARVGWRFEDTRVTQMKLQSYHAGLSDWEMLVPLLWQVI